jgi:hypothetical protein
VKNSAWLSVRSLADTDRSGVATQICQFTLGLDRDYFAAGLFSVLELWIWRRPTPYLDYAFYVAR